ncbi:MAG: hypothetical protein KA149_08775, partial [Chitinophagales bacterium]|nr:hypothetical protein [Chitinophagales bacterium]
MKKKEATKIKLISNEEPQQGISEDVLNSIIGKASNLAKKDANDFFTRLSIDKRISAKDLSERINKQCEYSGFKMVEWDTLFEKEKTVSLAFQRSYWRAYWGEMAIYTDRYLEITKPNYLKNLREKAQATKSTKKPNRLEDFFPITCTDIGKITYQQFMQALELQGFLAVRGPGVQVITGVVVEVLREGINRGEDSFKDKFSAYIREVKKSAKQGPLIGREYKKAAQNHQNYQRFVMYFT